MKKSDTVFAAAVICAALSFGAVVSCANGSEAGNLLSSAQVSGGDGSAATGTIAGDASSGGGTENGGQVSGNQSKILDLRIKKGGVLYDDSKYPDATTGAICFLTSGFVETQVLDDERLWESDRLQTAHCKVENVEGGLKFTITRPEEEAFDPNFVWKYSEYFYAGAGEGDYKRKYEYVGDGKGDYVKEEIPRYEYVGGGNGDYENPRYEYVGAGKGYYKKVDATYDAYSFYYGGDYIMTADYVGTGNGRYIKKIDEDFFMGSFYRNSGRGSYKATYEYVGDGNGDYKKNYRELNGGWIYAMICREEIIDGVAMQTTKASIQLYESDKDVVECVYPLCEPGERYVFKVVMEPLLSSSRESSGFIDEIYDKNCTMCEWLSIVAQDGIGDIDYSNVRDSDKCDLIYGETEATVKFEDCLPPNVKGVEPVFNIYATDSVEKNAIDWKTLNATVRWGVVSSNGSYQRCSDWQFCSLKDDLEKSYKNRFFARGVFGFYLNEGSGIDGWETAFIDSKIISIR